MHKLRSFWFLIFLWLPSWMGWSQTLEQGRVDLRSWDSDKKPLLSLAGETEFYWQDWIVSDPQGSTPSIMKIPSGWNFSGMYPAHGYGSYRITIQLDRPRPLRMMLHAIFSASRIYVDGQLVKTFGVLGQTADKTQADFKGSWNYSFTPKAAAFDVIVEVSNFDIFLGGMMTPVVLGTQDGVGDHIKSLNAYSFFLIGTVFIMGLYHFGLYSLRRSDRSTLYYGILCLSVGLYMLAGDPSDAWSLVCPLNLEWRILAYNYSWIICISVFLLYLNTLFPKDIWSKVVYGVSGFSLVYLLVISPMKVRSFVDSTQTYQFVAALVILYTIVVMIRAVRRQRDGARLFLFSIALLFVTVIHDLLMLRGLFTEDPWAGLGVFLFTFCQSYLLSARFSHAFQRAESSETEVRTLAEALSIKNDQVTVLNTTLEARVEEQTREIRSIMQSIELGIFAIHKSERVIHRDYSLFLESLLDQRNLENREALPLLFEHSNISPDVQHQVESVVNASVGESLLNFELNRDGLPRSMLRQAKPGESRAFELSWNPILRDDDIIDKLLVTINDVTDLRKWQQEARHSAEELTMVAEIINIRESEFQRFIKSSRELLQQNSILLRRRDLASDSKDILKVVLMNLHTVKGAARTLQFRSLADQIHSMEQATSGLASSPDAEQRLHHLIDEHQRLFFRINEYQSIAIEKLGRHDDHQMRLVLPTASAISAYTLLQDILNRAPAALTQSLTPLIEAMQRQLFAPLPDLMREILRSADSVARDLEKPIPFIDLHAPPLWVESQMDELLRHIFFHLIRNAMDHGIESAAERLRKEKPAEGRIKLHIRPEGDQLVFVLKDDGQGLQVGRILELARKQGLVKPSEFPPAQTIADLMFSFGMSTASEVTQLSGRGLGMSAVARFIAESGGHIQLLLLDEERDPSGGYPFAIIIRLPLKHFKDAWVPSPAVA